MKTIEYLDAVRDRHGLTSDNKLAALLEIDRPVVSSYRTGRRTLTQSDAAKVAESLEIDPTVVVADIQLERSKRPEEAAVWERAVEILKQATGPRA